MKNTNSRIHTARLHLIWGLALLMVACGDNTEKENSSDGKVVMHWDGNKATGLVIAQTDLVDFSKDSLSRWLKVQLGHSTIDILGEYSTRSDSVVFTPVIPFTRGFKYTVKWKGISFQQIQIPEDSTLQQGDVRFIYPSGDSLPANLLKMYILFSKPMAEGHALENIEVFKNKKQIPSTFLDLEQELWNKERTMLTVWFDPGRIKRDLQPNQQLGPPLEPGNRYAISIIRGWEDADGLLLKAGLQKDFIAIDRDEQSPDPATWTIKTPKARTRDGLVIDMHEPMDYGTLMSAVKLLDFKGNVVDVYMATSGGEITLILAPKTPWVPGYYSLEIEPRLEDLAGNNLERLFDKDLLKDTTRRKITTKRVFAIK